MPLTPTDLSALSRFIDDGLAIGVAHREAWLAGLPPEHVHLVDRLREMLVKQDRLSDSGPLSTLPQLPAADSGAQAGDAVGPYRLLREIGRGGMGSVWLAERADGHFDRQVALKLPRLSWADGLGERMARERRIGALLEHPAIARLYDAGLDALGRPFIAMEYIDGEPIDTFCRSRRLDVKAILVLFVQVVRAVAYAHGRLVIHRDLKPANVLVSSAGQAHLLDFGIAKLLDHAEVHEDSRLTREQGRMMTLHYAAPEQVAGQAVGVQADVYSLGVLLYELLTGVLPQTPRRSTAGAMEDAILDGDAPPASSRVPDRPKQRALRGEIDAILGKALQRDLARRYATADALADDIDRHLRGETVSARPDSMLYRTGKTLRRHWVGFAAGTAVLGAMITGSGVAVVQAQKAARSAERERVVKQFVADVFRVNSKVDPRNAALRPTSTQALLEGGAQLIQQRFAGQPELQAELYGVVGGVFSDMGAYSLAVDYATKQVEALATLGADPDEQARGLLALGRAIFAERNYADAQARVQRALALAGRDTHTHLDGLVLMGRIHIAESRNDEARKLLGAIEHLLAGRGGAPSPARAWAYWLQAVLLTRDNRFDEALPIYEKAIEAAISSEGRLSLVAVDLHLSLADRLAATRDGRGAREHFNAASEALRELGGPHAIRASFESARYARYRGLSPGRVTSREAMAQLEQSRAELVTSPLPIAPWFLPQIDFWIGTVLCTSGNVAAGRPLLERAAPVLKQRHLPLSAQFSIAHELGWTAATIGRHDQADRLLREALDIRRRQGQGSHPYAAVDYFEVAVNLGMQGQLREAEVFLNAAPQFQSARGEGTGNDRYNVVIQQARAWVKLLQGDTSAALEILRSSRPDPRDTEEDWSIHQELLGEATCRAGRPAEGLVLMKRALATNEAKDDYEHAPWRARLRANTGLCALAAGDRKLALQLATQARAAFIVQPEVSGYHKAPLFKLEAALGVKPPKVATSGDDPSPRADTLTAGGTRFTASSTR